MINVKESIHWCKWVRENLRNPVDVSDVAPYVVTEVLNICRTRRELAIALWVALDLVTLMSFETLEWKLEDVIEEANDDER